MKYPIDKEKLITQWQAARDTPPDKGDIELISAIVTAVDEAYRAGKSERRTVAEMESKRNAFIRTLPQKSVADIIEADRLHNYAKQPEIAFVVTMMHVYGAVPLECDGNNLLRFLVTLFHYGFVSGIRQERKKHNR